MGRVSACMGPLCAVLERLIAKGGAQMAQVFFLTILTQFRGQDAQYLQVLFLL